MDEEEYIQKERERKQREKMIEWENDWLLEQKWLKELEEQKNEKRNKRD
jgi:hypothetical protein